MLLFLLSGCKGPGQAQSEALRNPAFAGAPAATQSSTPLVVQPLQRNAGTEISVVIASPCATKGMHVLAYDYVCMFEIWPAVERFSPHERTEGLRPPVLVAIGPNLAPTPLPITILDVACAVPLSGPALFYLDQPYWWLTIDKFLNPFYVVPAELRGRPLYAQGFAARDADWTFPMISLPVVRFTLNCQ
jgi:hypothetical protein